MSLGCCKAGGSKIPLRISFTIKFTIMKKIKILLCSLIAFGGMTAATVALLPQKVQAGIFRNLAAILRGVNEIIDSVIELLELLEDTFYGKSMGAKAIVPTKFIIPTTGPTFPDPYFEGLWFSNHGRNLTLDHDINVFKSEKDGYILAWAKGTYAVAPDGTVQMVYIKKPAK